jgi:hypothetical protein
MSSRRRDSKGAGSAGGKPRNYRAAFITIALVAVVGAVCITYSPYVIPDSPEDQSADGRTSTTADGNSQTAALREQTPGPVAANRSADVPDGFRGAVHPILLHGKTKLELTAHWTQIGKGRDKLDEYAPETVYAVFRDAKPDRPTRICSERELSVFMPEKVESPGQMWALDLEKVAEILKQFHPHVSMHLAAKGRRAGPDGAFATLRAESDDYLDIAFRIHAEFNLTPKDFRRHLLQKTLWCTPACFAGRMVVNRKAGTVDYFYLDLPQDKSLNMHLTMFVPPYGEHHDIVRVEHMRLEGGNSRLLEETRWNRQVDLAAAKARLTHQFYKFNDIDWVPADKALAAAHERHKPIFAMVMWGSLDDQSC